MPEMNVSRIDAITLFVEDLERSKLFYQDVFGLSEFFEDANSAVFKFENTLINLLKVTDRDPIGGASPRHRIEAQSRPVGAAPLDKAPTPSPRKTGRVSARHHAQPRPSFTFGR
jgi:catechol 2,3-dioxygenase-like lactoylglutathione lyase family enzyme